MKEGALVYHPLLLDRSNYLHWKARIRAFIKSVDEKVWSSITNGWSLVTQMVEGKLIPKDIKD